MAACTPIHSDAKKRLLESDRDVIPPKKEDVGRCSSLQIKEELGRGRRMWFWKTRKKGLGKGFLKGEKGNL